MTYWQDPAARLTLAQLQRESLVWTRHNFPDKLPHHSLLGALEELGELAHAHLKAEQGIRGIAAEHHAMKVDAIGDVIIYLADYCNQHGIDMERAVFETWAKVRARDWVRFPTNGITE